MHFRFLAFEWLACDIVQSLWLSMLCSFVRENCDTTSIHSVLWERARTQRIPLLLIHERSLAEISPLSATVRFGNFILRCESSTAAHHRYILSEQRRIQFPIRSACNQLTQTYSLNQHFFLVTHDLRHNHSKRRIQHEAHFEKGDERVTFRHFNAKSARQNSCQSVLSRFESQSFKILSSSRSDQTKE